MNKSDIPLCMYLVGLAEQHVREELDLYVVGGEMLDVFLYHYLDSLSWGDHRGAGEIHVLSGEIQVRFIQEVRYR